MNLLRTQKDFENILLQSTSNTVIHANHII